MRNVIIEIKEKYGLNITSVSKPFIESCVNFFEKYNYLSDKQIRVIKEIQHDEKFYPRYRFTYSSSHDDDTRSYDADFGSAFDWGSQ